MRHAYAAVVGKDSTEVGKDFLSNESRKQISLNIANKYCVQKEHWHRSGMVTGYIVPHA